MAATSLEPTGDFYILCLPSCHSNILWTAIVEWVRIKPSPAFIFTTYSHTCTIKLLADMTSRPEYAGASAIGTSSSTDLGDQANVQQYTDKHTIPCGTYGDIPDATYTSGSALEASCSTLPRTLDPCGPNENITSITSDHDPLWHEAGSSKCLPYAVASEVLHTSLEDLVYPEYDEGFDGEHLIEQSQMDLKGKGKARTDDGIMLLNSSCAPAEPTHDFTFLDIFEVNWLFRYPWLYNNNITSCSFQSVEHWVVHTKSILGMYADRQIPLPLNHRVDISVGWSRPSCTHDSQALVKRTISICDRRAAAAC